VTAIWGMIRPGAKVNKDEARAILQAQLAERRSRSYADLQARVGSVDAYEVTGTSGAVYQIEVDTMWHGRDRNNILVVASIDDGGLRAFVPLCDSFIVAPDGSLVGE